MIQNKLTRNSTVNKKIFTVAQLYSRPTSFICVLCSISFYVVLFYCDV